tara:strand:- start:75 stop:551 length:477 start_codon:yes stop_codon:yes gene_type:complete
MLETARGFLADHMGRGTKDEVLGKIAVLFCIMIDHPILAGRHPMERTRGGFTNEYDIPKVGHALNIARIMPAEVFHLTLEENGNHSSGPLGILETLVSTLQSILDNGKDVAALEGIASRTHATLYLAKRSTSSTPLGGNRIGISRHLTRLGHPPDDIE